MRARSAADGQPGMETSLQETGAVSQTAQASSRMSTIPLAVPLLLSLPAWIPLLWTATRAWLNGQAPTAFVQYALAAAVANARQHFAAGFHLVYRYPYASS